MGRTPLALAALAALAFALPLASRAASAPIAQMHWRLLGPGLTEGRATAVVGSDTDPLLYYAGSAGGGVWKSVDGGASWRNVTDVIHLTSIGALALDPHDNRTLWVGGGETNPRNDVIQAGGLYRTTNGGRSWTQLALPGAIGISRILLDPKNPLHVVVGVLGSVYAPSAARGVYVSFDGGKTFAKTLYRSPRSGAGDLAMDPQDGKVIYAGLWHVARRPWRLTSGSAQADDGLFKSIDGGKTWSAIRGHGFPPAPRGRIGLAVAPSQPSRVFALVESAQGVLWRSDDAGATWVKVSSDTLADQRPFYFSHLRVAPGDPQTVYALSMLFATSYDGGKTFNFTAFGVHPDLHDLWISSNGERMALANDGGIAISVDGGTTWQNSQNMPIGQVYRVATSRGVPYLVCGGLQDNMGYCGPAFSGDSSGIANRDWFKVVDGDGEWAVPDPLNANLIWADAENGEVQIYNRRTHEATNIRPYRETAAQDFVLAHARYRFNWEAPIAFAAYDPHLAFLGANVVFATTDRGKHWRVISPDLTRDDKSEQQLAARAIVRDASSAENYGTLLDIESSPLHKGEIWTGSDDGLVHLTLDGGRHWRNVTPPGLPADSAVYTVAVSTLADGTAYVSGDRHELGDRKPYLFVTHDFGAHWQTIVTGLPSDQSVMAVRPDIRNRNVVYAGTDRGIFISCNDGEAWQSFQNNLPAVEVRDIRFQPQFDDMVIATHGRAIWVMDDLRPVQIAGCAAPTKPLAIAPRPAYALTSYTDVDYRYKAFSVPQPANSVGSGLAILSYWLPVASIQRPTIDIFDAKGNRIRHVAGKYDTFDGTEGQSYWLTDFAGKNTFGYDFSIDGPTRYDTAPFFFRGPTEGPRLPPGRYTMVLHLDGVTHRFPIELRPDPRAQTTAAEYRLTFERQRRYEELLDRVDRILNGLASVRAVLAKSPGMSAQVARIDRLVASITSSPKNFEDQILRPGQLREDVLGLMGDEPLAQATGVLYTGLEATYRARAASYNAWLGSLPAIDAALRKAGRPAFTLPAPAALVPARLAPIYPGRLAE